MPVNPWDRLPKETDPAYRAFLAYRDQGPGRTIEEAQRAVSGRSAGGKFKPSGRITFWSRTHNWTTRAKAWDAHLQERRDRAAADEAALDAGKWQRRKEQAREAHYQIGLKLRDKAEKMLAWPLSRQTTEQDGKTVVIEPAGWTYHSLARIMLASVKIEDDAIRGDEPGEGIDPGLAASQLGDNDKIPPDLAAQWRELAASRALEHQGLEDSQPD